MRSALFLVSSLLLANQVVSQYSPTNSTWNYNKNGTDWKMGLCNKKTYPLSPMNITNTDPTLNRDWLPYHWQFLPTFQPGSTTFAGFNNWVYMLMNNQTSTWAGWYATEPVGYSNNRAVYWDAYEIRFHYPAENKINNTQYDMEMQIYGYDYYNRHFVCTAGIAIISLLFKIDDANPNPFFDWQTDASAGRAVNIDLTQLVSKLLGVQSDITGYRGTDSMPDCGYVYCWYVV
jgi:hypothetical protein